MPQLTDRSKLPKLMDPVIRDKMDLKHLYQVIISEAQLLEYLYSKILLHLQIWVSYLEWTGCCCGSAMYTTWTKLQAIDNGRSTFAHSPCTYWAWRITTSRINSINFALSAPSLSHKYLTVFIVSVGITFSNAGRSSNYSTLFCFIPDHSFPDKRCHQGFIYR